MSELLTPGRRRAMLVAIWLLAIAVGASLAWVAVDRAGRAVLDPSTAAGALPVPTASPSAPSSITPLPTATPPVPRRPSVTPDPSTTRASQPGPVARTQLTDGGTVAVTCRGGAAELSYATPRAGWLVELRDRGPREVRVRFERAGSGKHSHIDVRASCSEGSPAFDVED
ncbi:MAG TPA: hypothetical protein VLC50_06885 [Actinomycetes bacterium]|nr:hypothetical protein [Actinomycetes bacterium]